MKFISWNVNGLRACAGKDGEEKEGGIIGFRTAFEALDADFFCLQETKMQAGQLDIEFPGYQSYWNYAEKKGYSGTAIFARHEPNHVYYGMGTVLPDAEGNDSDTIVWDEDCIHNHEGRVITLEYNTFYIITMYVPNAQDGLKRLDYRMQWEDAFRHYIKALDRKKPVIMCGDLNVAHNDIDLKNPKTNHMNPGFTDEERGKFTDLLASGFIDTYRTLHPDTVKYSWWSYRFFARNKNIGWRIDYFVCSERLKDQLKAAEIHNEVFGSDHCPVSVEIEL